MGRSAFRNITTWPPTGGSQPHPLQLTLPPEGRGGAGGVGRASGDGDER